MKIRTIWILIVVCLLIACEKGDNITEEQFYAKYGDNDLDIRSGGLYLCGRMDDEFRYTVIFGNGRCDWNLNDVKSDKDNISINFKGDSIDHLNGFLEMINDSGSYILSDYNDSTEEFRYKEFIQSGTVSVTSHYPSGYARTIGFKGETESGKLLEVNCFLSGWQVLLFEPTQIIGKLTMNENSYVITKAYMFDDSINKDIVINGMDVEDSLSIYLNVALHTSKEKLSGTYLGADSLGDNLFHAMIDVYNFDDIKMFQKYIYDGEIKLKDSLDSEYYFDFNLLTEDKGSIVGYFLSELE